MVEETVEQPVKTSEPELTVEVASDDTGKLGKPELTDEEVSKLDQAPPEDEIGRYAQAAQKRIKAMQIANQEWKRRAVQANHDMATATTLAQQLYQENQQLKTSVGRSETALIEQALQRTEAQLQSARQKAKAAYSSGNPDEIVTANEEVARYVAEADRLRLLRPAAGQEGEAAPHNQPSQNQPPSPAQSQRTPVLNAWLERNPWFQTDERAAQGAGDQEMTRYAMEVHGALASQGITEGAGDKYWGVINERMRERFPDRFSAPPKPNGRPVTVTGATRTNGAAASPPRSPRHVVLSESQVRIAHSLGLSPEQYAAQLIKDQAAKGERVQ